MAGNVMNHLTTTSNDLLMMMMLNLRSSMNGKRTFDFEVLNKIVKLVNMLMMNY